MARQEPKMPVKQPATKLSKACADGKHANCYSMKCSCACHKGGQR